jgi:hypothetical protein
VERRLLESFHYCYCVELGQLGPVRAYRLDPGALQSFYARLAVLGIRPGDSKPLPLRRELTG